MVVPTPSEDVAAEATPTITVSSTSSECSESTTGSSHVSKKKLKKMTSSTPRNERSFLYRSSSYVIGWIEKVCGLWGFMIASNPWKVILISFLLAGISGGGLYYLTFEFRPYKLWVKEPSEFKMVHEWKMEKFPNAIRKHIAIWERDNILTAKAIKQMWNLHQKIESSRSQQNQVRYSDVCLKVPSLISHHDPEIVTKDYEEYEYDGTYDLPEWISDGGANTNDPKYVYKRDAEPLYGEFEYDDYAFLEPNKTDEGPSWLTTFMSINSSRPSSNYLSSENASLIERQDHCEFVEDLDLICYEESLLEVWGFNDDIITSLTDKKVMEDVNEFSSSRVTGFPVNVTSYLGGIERDINGRIISAKGAIYTWYTKVDMQAIRECEKSGCKIEIDLGSGEEVDVKSMEWEVHLTNIVNEFKKQGAPVNLQASYLFGSVHRSALFQDFVWVCAGWVVLMVYVVFSLAKPFSVERRVIPVLIGIACIGLSVMASYGICTVSGIPYGPLNSVLPILLIALGVDDMYVILSAWDSTKHDADVVDVSSRTRKTLHQAGLAITVTSLTDVIAFIVGATTEVPALRYFCVYAAVGITVVYLLQVSLFVATLVLNQRSKTSSKRSCLPCKAFTDDNTNGAVISKWMGKWTKFLLKPPVTAFVLVSTGLFLGGAICQTMDIKQKFESVWLLPTSSDIYKWFDTMDKIFPKNGREGFIFFEGVQLPEELPELQKLTTALRKNPYVSRVDAWFEKLLDFIDREDLFKGKPLDKALFDDALSYFLFNEDGAKYRNDIVFYNETALKCTEPVPQFNTFKISFQYIRLGHAPRHETQKAMNSVRQLVSEAKLTGYRAPWALSYGQWETENVISHELLRNVVVVLVIVFVMTMILLASFRAALLVLICVLATLVDVAALMSFWGLTINTVTCIALVLAIGVCVDYAAHITHGFLVAQGSRKFRAESAVHHMGPAVFHGGMSTLLAFILLSPADTYVFLSYFKILTGVAIFGLYHALVLLPILLAMLGPPPYPVSLKGDQSSEDSHSCTTESTNYPYTPNSITPAITPQSTTPNSPSSDRTIVSMHHENSSFESDEGNSKKGDGGKILSPVYQQIEGVGRSSNTMGHQALKNMTSSTHKVNMFVKGTERDKEDIEEIRNCSLIESPAIRKENVLKLYIKNS